MIPLAVIWDVKTNFLGAVSYYDFCFALQLLYAIHSIHTALHEGKNGENIFFKVWVLVFST